MTLLRFTKVSFLVFFLLAAQPALACKCEIEIVDNKTKELRKFSCNGARFKAKGFTCESRIKKDYKAIYPGVTALGEFAQLICTFDGEKRSMAVGALAFTTPEKTHDFSGLRIYDANDNNTHSLILRLDCTGEML